MKWHVFNSQAHSARLGRSQAFLKYNHQVGALRERCKGRLLYLLEISLENNLLSSGLPHLEALTAADGSSRNLRTMWSRRPSFSKRSLAMVHPAPVSSTGQRSVESTFNNHMRYLSFLSIAILIVISPRSISLGSDARNLVAS